ncbi:MAG: hypothetical protein JNK14_18545 [Chitinophagaceae bacterium]|nr:hypothetical protein [Chitinophagaceae bacterium]
MKSYLLFMCVLLPLLASAQDSTMNTLLRDMNDEGEETKRPVHIFNGVKAINANTTEMTGKGKMDFRVTHNFDDIDGDGGILGRFLGLDNVRDVRIGFHLGLSDKLDVNIARVKGAGPVGRIYELAFKYLFIQQRENDPTHPLSVALFVNAAAATNKASSLPNFEHSFRSFSDRLSQTVQLIIARKFGKVSLQLNPTFVNTNYTILNDDVNMFAIGGAARIPVTRHLNIVVDYFHPFRSKSSKDFFKTVDDTYNPPSDVVYNPTAIKFYDPIGISFEILTAGHIFNLNFTNATEILENRFIPRTTSSWAKGKFRWGFTIARKFVIWRPKK